MTETTDIAALRRRSNNLLTADQTDAFIDLLLDKLEAEHQQRAVAEKARDSWQKVCGEIMSVIPLSEVIRVSGTVSDSIKYFKKLQAENEELHEKLSKPVVLPAVPDDFVLNTGGKQLHFGIDARKGESLWHSRLDGSGLWCGHWYDRTLQELESECFSTLASIQAAIKEAGYPVREK